MRPPIADPFGPPAPFPEESRIFRRSFWRIYVGTLLFSAFFLVPMQGTLFWVLAPQTFVGSGRSSLASLLVFMVLINPLVGTFSAVLRPLRVTRFGIQGPPSVGFVEWAQMKSVRTFWLGYPCARVGLRRHLVALWIPLALLDWNGFARTLEEWAPEGNPLRVWAQKRG
jgi:hypothetical protein